MAFKKKTWTDRMVEYAGRRKLTNISTKQAIVYDVERAEGTVSKEGDAFSSQNMNDFEQRVEDGFAGVQQDINEINSDLDGCSFDVKGDGAYIIYTPPGGADPVSKKLGSIAPELKVAQSGQRAYTYQNGSEERKKVIAVAFFWTDWYYTPIVTNGTLITNIGSSTHGMSAFEADLLPGDSFTFGIADGPSLKEGGLMIFEYV